MSTGPALSAASPVAPPPLTYTRGRSITGWLREFQRDSLGTVLRLGRDYGDAVKVGFGPIHYYFFNHPDSVKHLFVDKPTNFVKTPNALKLRRFLGDGLLLSEGEFWRRQRRIAQPGFHRQRLAAIADRLTAAADSAVLRLRSASRGEPGRGASPSSSPDPAPGPSVDVTEATMHLALEAVSTSLFGSRIGAGDAARLAAALTVAQHDAQVRTESFIDWPFFVPTTLNRASRRALAELDRIVYGLIDARRRDDARPDDLLTLLLETRDADTGETMSNHELRDEVATLLVAGHETTANALAWTLHLLADNPAVEETLRAELTTALGGRAPGLGDLRALPYTLMVIEEAMRLYPPVWLTERRALTADVIGGHRVPKDALIFVSPYAMHRHRGFWPDPERFDPTRFSTENTAGRPRYAYFPFGGGPRQCIGKEFALMELCLALPRLLQAFRFTSDPTHPVETHPQVTLRPRHGIWMHLRPA